MLRKQFIEIYAHTVCRIEDQIQKCSSVKLYSYSRYILKNMSRETDRKNNVVHGKEREFLGYIKMETAIMLQRKRLERSKCRDRSV